MAKLSPIPAVMGLNFAIVVGAICAQIGFIIAIDNQLHGAASLVIIAGIGITLSVIAGYLIGLCLNRTRGREMITTIIIGFFTTSIYQLIFMVGYGTVITPGNPEILLSRGVGIRNMIDLVGLRNLFDEIWLVHVGELEFPLLMISVVLIAGLLVRYIMHTPTGVQFKAAGSIGKKVELVGMSSDSVRIKAMICSTVIACFGHIIYVQNIGMLNIYTAHLNTDIFSCAALLAGGATITKAKVRHAFMGIVLFHSLSVVSPQAGQNVFGNPALGEYFRSFVAYGTIAIALMMNYQKSNQPTQDRHNNNG